MFDKIKNLNKLKKAQKEMEVIMDKIVITKEKAGITVAVNANNKVLKIDFEGDEDKITKDLLNDALKEAKKKSGKKLRGQMANLGLGDLL